MSTSLEVRMSAVISRIFTSISNYSSLAPITNDSNSFVIQDALSYGTGADEANVCYHRIGMLEPGQDSLLDVAGGLVDAFGQQIIMSKVKCVAVQHRGTSGTISVGGGANAMGHGGNTPTLVVVGARPEDEGVVAACKLDRGEGAGVTRNA